MSGLVALGAGIAALTGIGGGIALVLQRVRQRRQSPASRRLPARSRRTCCWRCSGRRYRNFGFVVALLIILFLGQ